MDTSDRLNFNDLNYDCISAIFSLISFQEIIKKRPVCKLWCQHIDHHITNIRHFTYTKEINGIRFRANDGGNDDAVAEESDRDFNARFNNRMKMTLDLVQFDFCLKRMPNLQSLTIDGVDVNDAIVPIMASWCPNIVKLKIVDQTESLSMVSLNLLVEKYPQLTHLDMPNTQLDDDTVFLIAKKLHNLIHLNFSKDRDKANRLARFTGRTLKYLGPKIKSLMIGEPIYYDENLIRSIIFGNARNVSVLSIHLIKLKDLKEICEKMTQLKEFYLSFNGGDINSQDKNIGCVRYIAKLTNLEVLIVIDDGRHHCNGSNGCFSVYTAQAFNEIIQKCSKLRCLNLLDYDNWHSKVQVVDEVLSQIKQCCPFLTTFGISAGLFELTRESYNIIANMNMVKLNLQGDLELLEMHTNQARRKNNLNDSFIVRLCKSNTTLKCLMASNSNLITKESLDACLEMAKRRPHEKFNFAFVNTAVRPLGAYDAKPPENVTLDIHHPEFHVALDDLLAESGTDDDEADFDYDDTESDHTFHSYFSDDDSMHSMNMGLDPMESDSDLE